MRRSELQRGDDALVRDTARRYLADRHAFRPEPRASDAASRWRAYADLGWFAMALLETRGGLGADATQCLSVLEEAGRVLLPDALGTDVLLAPRLAGAGLPDPIAADLAAGDARFALVTPTRRGDPLRARRGPGGLTLAGRSAVSLGLAEATHMIVALRDPADDGALVLIVPAGDVTASRLVDGRAGGVFQPDGLSVPETAVLSDGAAGATLAADLADHAAAALAADALGALAAGLDEALAYLKTRRQFGAPLSTLQAVQHKMADVYCAVEAFRSLNAAMALSLDAPARERRAAVAAAKAYLGGRVLDAAGTLIQVCGGIAMTEAYMVGHVYKRLLTSAALCGSTAQHLRALDDATFP